MSIKWDKASLKKLENSMSKALEEFGDELDKDIKEKQIVPKQTGTLEDSQKMEVKGKDTLRISYSTDYAARVYFHPEYKFNRDINTNAQGKWLDAIFNDDELIKKYAKILKRKV